MRRFRDISRFRGRTTRVFRWGFALSLVTLGILAVIRSHYQFAVVVGESMQPTFRSGDLLIVDRAAYRGTPPARGDVVVAHYRKDLVVKRVVALPGEVVELKTGRLCIDGQPVVEPYPTRPGTLSVSQGRMLEGRFATLGDNRRVSPAQAVHPIVSVPDILGKVVFCFHCGS
jgi:signal peptidase I